MLTSPYRLIRRASRCCALALCVGAGLSGPAMAAGAADEDTLLQDVVVTAQFREEALQETPIAITAISGAELDERGFSDAFEVAYTVPNASFRPAQGAYGNTMTAYIRGIGQYDFDFAFEPGVGIYVDDVYHPFTLGSSVELLDLERVEVLRGPQGTLFGRGSIGGAIRYVSKKAEGSDTGSISVTTGRYDRVDLRASYDFGITDSLFARVTGISSSRSGYQDVLDFTCANPLEGGTLPVFPVNQANGCKIGTQGGENVVGARGALRWIASDRLELNLSTDVMNSRAEPKADTITQTQNVWPTYFFTDDSETEDLPYDDRFVPSNPYISYATYTDPLSGLTFVPKTKLDKLTVSGRADLMVTNDISASLIASYTDLTSTLVSDADGSPLNLQMTSGVQTVDFHTIELRFSGRAFDRTDWTVGGFFYDGKSVNDQVVSIPFLSDFLDGVDPDDPSDPFVNAHNVHNSQNKSAFVHAVTDLTDRLSLTSGLRYSEDEKLVNFDNKRVQNPNVPVKGDKTDWRIGLDYKVNDDVMVYTSASTGYRPGSYNPRPFQATQVVAVDQEESTAYELGVKADLLDRRLRVNVAAFYTDWGNRILPVSGTECPLIDLGPPPVYDTVDPSDPDAVEDSLGNFCLTTVSRTFYENSPGEVRGAEAEVTWEPIRGLAFNGSLGLLEWDSPDINDDPTVLSSRPVYVPKKNWSLSAAYTLRMPDGAALTPRLDVYGQSRICSQTVRATSTFPDASCAEPYELLNARVEWVNADRAWTVAAGATNLANKKYFLNKFDLTAFGQPQAEGQPARPREWYVSLTRQFN